MSEDPLHQPHDKLFKSAFGDPATAAGFLRWEIPAALSSAIDWDHLRLEPGSFVDSHYRHSESDLLFSSTLGASDCLVYLLFEHQLAPDPWIALRLLRYQVRIWETWRKSHPESGRLPVILPVILPVVLAQNAEVWKISPQFSSLLDIPASLVGDLEPLIPDFTYRLIQLAEMPFDAIRGTPAGILTLRVMKAERLEKLLEDIVWDESLLVRVPKEMMEMLIRYILHADVDIEAFDRRVIRVTTPEIQNTVMTLAQKLRQEGRLDSLQENVIAALEIRFGGIPKGMREAITGVTDESSLRLLLRAAIQASSVEDFSLSL